MCGASVVRGGRVVKCGKWEATSVTVHVMRVAWGCVCRPEEAWILLVPP